MTAGRGPDAAVLAAVTAYVEAVAYAGTLDRLLTGDEQRITHPARAVIDAAHGALGVARCRLGLTLGGHVAEEIVQAANDRGRETGRAKLAELRSGTGAQKEAGR